MKFAQLWDSLDETMNIKKKMLCRDILEREEVFYIYKRGEFFPLSGLETEIREEIRRSLEMGEPKQIFIDDNTKKNMEENEAVIKCGQCEWGIFTDSTIEGILTIKGKRIMVTGSSISGNTTQMMYDVLIENGARILESTIALVHLDGATVLGSNVYYTKMEPGSLINWYSFAANGNIIRKNVLIGPNCNIMSRTYSYHRPLEYFVKNTLIEEEVIEIGAYTWIGANTSIIKGVKIGEWSLLAAGSVVSFEVPAFHLATDKKVKSIVERVKPLLEESGIIERMLRLDNIQSDQGVGTIYTNVKERMIQEQKEETYFKIFYLYTHSKFIRESKKVTAMGIEYPFVYDEYLFEFFTPDTIDITVTDKKICLEYNEIYTDIEDYRDIFIQKLCSFGEVKKIDCRKYEVYINEKECSGFRYIDKIFDEEIINLINKFNIPIEMCEIDLKSI